MDIDLLGKEVQTLKTRLHDALEKLSKIGPIAVEGRVSALEQRLEELKNDGGLSVAHIADRLQALEEGRAADAQKVDELATALGELTGTVGEIAAGLERLSAPQADTPQPSAQAPDTPTPGQ